jgi:hypothetical protein
MSRPISTIMLAVALSCTSGCDKPEPTKTEPTRPEPAKTEPAVQPPPSLASEEPVDPPWFDAAKIPHATVIKQMASQGLPTGPVQGMVLELEDGVSSEQCIERAKAAIGESVAEIPEAVASDDGRLTIQGKTADYEFTIVCGEAKGKPTLYMSYSR